MSGRSSAFLLTGLCTVVAIGLVGATQSSATNQAAAHPPTLTPQDSGTTQGLIAVSPVNKRVVWASGRGGTFAVTTERRRDVEVRCRARCRVAAVSRRRGRERHGRVSALHRPGQRFPDLQDNRRWRDVVAAVPEPGSGRILRLLRLLDAHTGLCPERLRERAVPGGANDERTDVGEHRRQRACGASRRVVLRVERHLCRHGGQEQRVGRHRRRVPVQGPRHARRR